MSEKEMSVRKRLIILFGIIVLFVVIDILPCPEGLPPEGKRSVALMVCTAIAWMTSVFPLLLSSLAALLFMPLLGLCTLPETADLFSEPVLFFIISNYIVANGMAVTGLDKRITLLLALASGGNAKKLLFIFMMGAAALSTVLSDMGVVLMMLPIALMLLQATGCRPGESNYGRAVMIGLPLAAYIGGMGTPAGASTNVLALTVLENTAGIKITFSQWAMLGLPIVAILTPIVFFIVWYAYKPEITILNGMEDAKERLENLGKMSKQEKKFIIIMILLVAVWLTESFHGINIAITTTFGALAFFLPGVDVLKWENTKDCIRWDIVILVSCCSAMATVIWNSGAAGWFATIISGMLDGKSLVVMLIVLGLVCAYAHLICPSNPAIVSIFVPIACAVAVAQGLNPASLAIPIGFMVSAACLIPLDVIALVCFATGYFKMTQMFRSGFFVIFAWVGVVTLVMVTIAPLFGII